MVETIGNIMRRGAATEADFRRLHRFFVLGGRPRKVTPRELGRIKKALRQYHPPLFEAIEKAKKAGLFVEAEHPSRFQRFLRILPFRQKILKLHPDTAKELESHFRKPVSREVSHADPLSPVAEEIYEQLEELERRKSPMKKDLVA